MLLSVSHTVSLQWCVLIWSVRWLWNVTWNLAEPTFRPGPKQSSVSRRDTTLWFQAPIFPWLLQTSSSSLSTGAGRRMVNFFPLNISWICANDVLGLNLSRCQSFLWRFHILFSGTGPPVEKLKILFVQCSFHWAIKTQYLEISVSCTHQFVLVYLYLKIWKNEISSSFMRIAFKTKKNTSNYACV